MHYFFVIALLVSLLRISSLDVHAQSRHGMWVYGVVPRPGGTCPATTSLLDEDPDANQVLSFCAANPITEVYLSLGPGAGALSNPRFPNFMRQLKNSGLIVEALVGCDNTSTGDFNCEAGTWKMHISDVKAYNDGAPVLERFDGIHLDLEPWKDTGSDFRWVDNLIGYYQYASSALEGSGLTLAADISGVKVISAMIDREKRQALLDAATRLVLMEYEETSTDRIYQRVETFRNAVDLSTTSFMIATRVQDFAVGNNCTNGMILKGFDDSYTSAPGYAGWATFKYSDSSDCKHYNDSLICPGDCCVIRP